MKVELLVRYGPEWSLSKVVDLPVSNLHAGRKIELNMTRGRRKDAIMVSCVLTEERNLVEGCDTEKWEAQITFVGPGARALVGGKKFVDSHELFVALKKCGWENLSRVVS